LATYRHTANSGRMIERPFGLAGREQLIVVEISLGSDNCPRVRLPPNGLEMSRPASQGQYRAKLNTRLAGSAPSSC